MICKFESGQLVMGEWLIPNGSALRLCYTDGKPAVRKPSNINIGHKVNFRETKNVCFFLSLFFFGGGVGGGESRAKGLTISLPQKTAFKVVSMKKELGKLCQPRLVIW